MSLMEERIKIEEEEVVEEEKKEEEDEEEEEDKEEEVRLGNKKYCDIVA